MRGISNGTTRFVFSGNGKVGIGTALPEEQLTIRNTSQHCLIRIISGNASGVSAGIDFGDSDDTDIGRIRYYHDNNYMRFDTNAAERLRINSAGNVQIGTSADPGNALRYVDIGNYNTGGSAGSILRLITRKSDGSSTVSADIVKYKNGGLVINNNESIGTEGFISFGTATNGGSASTRLRIRADGNIGINNTNPLVKLHITDGASGGDGITEILRLNASNNNTNDGNKIQFTRVNGASGSITCQKVASNNTTDMIFGTRSYNTESESMRLTGSGNLGINHDTSGASTNAPLTIKNSTNSSATRFNLVNSGSSQVESTQIYSQNNDLAFVANANEALRIKDTGTVEFKGGDQSTDALAVRSENGGASVLIANFRGVTDTGDTGRLGVGKNNNALIYMNASGSQVDTFAIGNTDNVPLVFSTHNTERIRILGSGNMEMAQNIRLVSKPNSTWSAGVVFGGNGYGGSSTNGSCAITNGNFHIDARSGSYGMYLNWYAGNNGTYFGNGGGSQRGRIDGSGNLTLSGTYPGSDLRLKENIQNISGATDTIKSLVGKTFTWKAEAGLDSYKHYGFIAQEVQKVVPDLVKAIGCHYFDKDDNLIDNIDPTESDEERDSKGLTKSLTVNSEGVTPILVEAMKELIAKVETLEAEVASLKSS